MDGATNGSPPCFRINCSISTARRLSSASTRSPPNPMPDYSEENTVPRKGVKPFYCLHLETQFAPIAGVYRDRLAVLDRPLQ